MPACAAAHEQELGVDPLRRDADGFRWRTRSQIEEERSWLWVEDGVILFKAEASAWTPEAVQLQQVWVDPEVRRQRLRGARALATSAGCSSSACRPSACSSAPRTRPRFGCTRRSGWSTCSTTARSSSDVVDALLLARHAFAGSNRDGIASCATPGEGLTPEGVEQARALRAELADEPISLAATTELARTQETLALALDGRDVRVIVVPELNEIDFGVVRRRPARRVSGVGGGAVAVRAARPAVVRAAPTPPHDSRAGCDVLLARAESVVLLVGHALALRYVARRGSGVSSRCADGARWSTRIRTGSSAPRSSVRPSRSSRRWSLGATPALLARSLERRTSDARAASDLQP